MKPLRPLILLTLSIFLIGCDRSTSYKPKKLDPNTQYDDVYLLMGQSNASGCAFQSYLETKAPEVFAKYTTGTDKVMISYDCDERIENNFVPTQFGFGNNAECFGPEIGMAEVLSKQEGTSYIIKATYSGSCLLTEYVSVDKNKQKLYKRFISFIKQQLKTLVKQGKTPRVRGVFWMQGESDTFVDDPTKYRDGEQLFLEYLRHDLNPYIYEYFNFVDAYIFTRGICWVHPEIINDCKQRLADENEHCYCKIFRFLPMKNGDSL